MKPIRICLWCVVFLFVGNTYAQGPLNVFNQKKLAKPLLFSALPEQFECSDTALHRIVMQEKNDFIISQLSSQFLIKGRIVDKSHQNSGSFSINIKLDNYDSALFNFSGRLLADNSLLIRGRILHPKYEDVLVLYKEKEKYYFRKTSQRLYMPE